LRYLAPLSLALLTFSTATISSPAEAKFCVFGPALFRKKDAEIYQGLKDRKVAAYARWLEISQSMSTDPEKYPALLKRMLGEFARETPAPTPAEFATLIISITERRERFLIPRYAMSFSEAERVIVDTASVESMEIMRTASLAYDLSTEDIDSIADAMESLIEEFLPDTRYRLLFRGPSVRIAGLRVLQKPFGQQGEIPTLLHGRTPDALERMVASFRHLARYSRPDLLESLDDGSFFATYARNINAASFTALADEIIDDQLRYDLMIQHMKPWGYSKNPQAPGSYILSWTLAAIERVRLESLKYNLTPAQVEQLKNTIRRELPINDRMIGLLEKLRAQKPDEYAAELAAGNLDPVDLLLTGQWGKAPAVPH
jgi:hypothetical protein